MAKNYLGRGLFNRKGHLIWPGIGRGTDALCPQRFINCSKTIIGAELLYGHLLYAVCCMDKK
jgi:hypothetical protein